MVIDKIKRLEVSLGITLFRKQIIVSLTPFIWRRLYAFVPDKAAKSTINENCYNLFIGPLRLWNFDANDMFEISLDFNFNALNYIPKAPFATKRIL